MPIDQTGPINHHLFICPRGYQDKMRERQPFKNTSLAVPAIPASKLATPVQLRRLKTR